jgi:hypothetical protein
MSNHAGRQTRSPGMPPGIDPDTLAGRIAVELHVADGAVTQVDVQSSRPQLAARLLRGQPADLAAQVVPRLYSLCAGAHAVAAQRARQGALGIEADASQVALWTRRLEVETGRETLWRALIDWPKALGETPDPAALAALRRAQIASGSNDDLALLQQIVERHVLGTQAVGWLAQEPTAALRAWMASAVTPSARFLAMHGREAAWPTDRGQADGRSVAAGDHMMRGATDTSGIVALLPSLADERVAASVGAALRADPAFAQWPLWQGAPAETGALARMDSDPRIAALRAVEGVSPRLRWIARLIELARIAAGMASALPRHGALALPDHAGQRCGLGWAETARGVLVHVVSIDSNSADARVVDYRVLAPTEWNFHPRGVLAATLTGQPAGAPEVLRERAQQLIDALDPCVACALHVREEAAIA